MVHWSILLGLGALFVAFVLSLILSVGRSSKTGHMDDVSLMRGILQGIAYWGQDHNGIGPIPSIVDANDATVGDSEYKNRTGSVYSVLLYHEMISPGVLISYFDHPDRFKRFDWDPSLPAPVHALKPSQAVYDPMFKGTPKDVEEHIPQVGSSRAGVANASFALAPMWDTNVLRIGERHPIVSHRGPRFEPDPEIPGGYRPHEGDRRRGAESPALDRPRSYGAGVGGWNVGFGDGSVQFLMTPVHPDRANHLFVHGDVAGAPVPDRDYMRMFYRGVPLGRAFDSSFVDETDGAFVWVDGDSLVPAPVPGGSGGP
ncbi:MAG: hypothetical protein ACTS3F_03825 [Phycisphaerales bacterium]